MKLTMQQIDQLHHNQLTSQEIIFLKLRASGCTLQEIADLLGLSRQWVAKVIEGAITKIEAQHEKV